MREACYLGFLMMTILFAADGSASSSDGAGDVGANDTPLTGTIWTLVTVAEEPFDPGPVITLRFEAKGILSGFDGCNQYRGTFSVDGSAIHIPYEMVTTRMACPEPVSIWTRAYLRALGNAASYSIDGNRLGLHDAAGHEVMVLESASLMLAGSAWEVMAYNNGKQALVSVLGGTRITARFGEEGRVTGSAGCNRYFASYAVEGESISIGLPGATRRFCREPDRIMEQEAGYLEVLHSAASFRIGAEKLVLRTADGALALTLAHGSIEPLRPDPLSKAKIVFSLDRLDVDGLQGPPDGKRALHYEYCIPDRPEAIREVTDIDPTLEIQGGSPGRVGCGAGELLCLGHTHQPNQRAVLERLARLPFVAEIHEAFFE